MSESSNILSSIHTPEDLRALSESQLHEVCTALRQCIIDEVSTNPGHFGASLGVVELTVALHYVFNTPTDNLIWDVGHQAYAHKLLTGRRTQFHSNRKYQGLSGFPKRSESEYDAFGTGHASTSISAALGMAVAAKQKGENKKNIAIIGDGSFTGGLAYEGLNNASMNNADLLIILNDNNMAIDPNVGGMSKYLVNVTTSKTYNRVKKDIWNLLGKLDHIKSNTRSLFQNFENSVKSFMLKEGNIFEALGIRYFGPIDGHDIQHLTKVLKDMKDLKGPRLLHIITQKGKGYKHAEEDQTKWHAPGLFNKETGEILQKTTSSQQAPKFQEVFGHTLVELAEQNDKIIGITPAMPSGSSMNLMMEAMPDRAFDVGIAEGHAVTFSAGLACEGAIPFCNIYSTFMQRAYDNVIHDVALQNLNVVFCLDRGGLVGEDGATHHGVFDLAYFRCIPNMTVSAAYDEEQLRNLMYTAQLPNQGAFSIRYPRRRGSKLDWKQPFQEIKVGTGRKLKEGQKVAILSIGAIGSFAAEAIELLAQEGIQVGHYDMRFLKPIDETLLHEAFSQYEHLVTLEDGCVIGGLGSAVLEFKNDHHYSSSVNRLGVPDNFVEQGTQQELYRECGYDVESILSTVRSLLN